MMGAAHADAMMPWEVGGRSGQEEGSRRGPRHSEGTDRGTHLEVLEEGDHVADDERAHEDDRRDEEVPLGLEESSRVESVQNRTGRRPSRGGGRRGRSTYQLPVPRRRVRRARADNLVDDDVQGLPAQHVRQDQVQRQAAGGDDLQRPGGDRVEDERVDGAAGEVESEDGSNDVGGGVDRVRGDERLVELERVPSVPVVSR